VVVSNKMTNTIVVRVHRLVRHPKYNRTIKQANKFKAHDETNTAAVGDWVRIMETRPFSRDKRWRLVEIIKRASTAPPVPGQEEAEQPRQANRPVAASKDQPA
jgi:small subunit ribosomal protein S17